MIDSMDYMVGSLVKVRGREWVVLPASSEDLLRPLGGQLPAFEREQRVARLGTFPRRLLVATDCLSEGVNLQDHFNAVVHYDLSWNPTRHEQREGRVDRYGQPSPTVRTLTYYGVDNQIDGIVARSAAAQTPHDPQLARHLRGCAGLHPGGRAGVDAGGDAARGKNSRWRTAEFS